MSRVIVSFIESALADASTHPHTEHALRLAEILSNGDAKHMVLGKIFEEPFGRAERKAPDIDTRGFVLLKFGSTEDEMTLAIRDFNQVLEMEPDGRLPAEHLLEAYKKKKELERK